MPPNREVTHSLATRTGLHKASARPRLTERIKCQTLAVTVKAWSNGQGTYGLRIGAQNRDEHFDPTWTEIEVEIDGQLNIFSLAGGFWSKCPEFRDRDQKLSRWIAEHGGLSWPRGGPHAYELVPLGGNRFRLQSHLPGARPGR